MTEYEDVVVGWTQQRPRREWDDMTDRQRDLSLRLTGAGVWHNFGWPTEDNRVFEINVGLDVIDGRWEIIELNVMSFRGRALTSEHLRAISLPELRRRAIDAARRLHADLLDEHGGDDPEARAEAIEFLPDFSAEVPSTIDADHYLDVAAAYARAWEDGEDPRAAVAERWGLHERTASRRIAKARNEYGFLFKTKPGQADGRLTAKAKRRIAARDKGASDGEH